MFVNTFWSLVPPIVAIGLALLTKETYSSLFIGIVVGALLATDFSPIGALDTIINDGLTAAIADNAGIFLFLVILGVMVALVNAPGGSAAFRGLSAVICRAGIFGAVDRFADSPEYRGRGLAAGAAAALLGLGGSEHGVDSLTAPKAPAGLAAALAQKLGCVVLLSGTEDLIADGQQLCTVRGGSDRMRTVTGAGCMLSVLCGAFAAVQPGDAFTAAVQAARFWKACAEQAEDHAAGAGSFRVALFDAAGNMTDEVFAGK